MEVSKYFELLSDWQKLPAYSIERRIDSIIGYYLPLILSEFCGTAVNNIVIPELPIRIGDIDSESDGKKNRSKKVDFMAVGINNNIIYLIELKTDIASINKEQLEYLESTRQQHPAKIINGIVQLAKISKAKDKYRYLLDKLKILGLLNESNEYTGTSNMFEVIFILPSSKTKKNLNGKIIDFKWIINCIENHIKESKENVEFEKEFIKLLAACITE